MVPAGWSASIGGPGGARALAERPDCRSAVRQSASQISGRWKPLQESSFILAQAHSGGGVIWAYPARSHSRESRSTSLTALPSSRRGDLRDGEQSRTVSLSKGENPVPRLRVSRPLPIDDWQLPIGPID